MNTASNINGPHSAIPCSSPRERFIATLFDALWCRYRERVSYVRDYERVIQNAGARFVNDHIAFRTIACCEHQTGIATMSRIFEALGYRPAGCYSFEDKHLNAIHYQHPNLEFPKVFISELKTWELETPARANIVDALGTHRPPVEDEVIACLASLDVQPDERGRQLVDTVLHVFHDLPWRKPDKQVVLATNEVSQYAAWVLVHGYNVNHFTSLINSHQVEQLRDIEKTVQALRDAGVPMKENIEGEAGSRLRQSATQAVTIDVDVREQGRPAKMPWTYAYFELAERGEITDPETERRARFEGFLGPQATHLFDMTTVKD